MNDPKQLHGTIDKLTSLLEASRELNSSVEIEVVLSRILRQMLQVIEAEAGTLWLLDQDHNQIEAKVAEGPSKDKILGIKMKPGEGIVGEVIACGEAHLVEDVTDEPGWAKRVDGESGFVTRSMMTIPLNINGTPAGALQLLNKKNNRYFNGEDLQLALSLAHQSALALHNSQIYDEMFRMSASTIKLLTKIIDARDPYTAGHSGRVARYTVWIARELNLDENLINDLERATLLHDIGKLGIPDHILGKPGRLTDDEYNTIKNHPAIGADILSSIEPKKMRELAVQIARHHHERLDGSGYPDQLSGNEIPLPVRIVAVSDSFDAMTTVRPYSNGRSYREAVDELLRCRDILFDRKVVNAFADLLKTQNYQIDNAERPGIIKSN